MRHRRASKTYLMPSSKYRWNAGAGRYTLRGRFVKQSVIRAGLDSALASTGRRAATLATRLQGGRVSLTEWERLMRELIKDTQLYSAALARGGWAQMTPADYGKVGGEVRKQYTYLNRFAAQIQRGLPLGAAYRVRVTMYMEAGRKTYYDTLDQVMLDAGLTEEHNFHTSADPCDECPALTAMGWVEIGTLPQVGNRRCLNLCKCRKEYR